MLDAGGLFILGTERHESRRIDNQLRGRSGRQGDPGESRFFLSAQDDLVRLFAGERIYKILDRLGSVDDEGNEEPIEHGMLSKQIEKAQRKVEEQHFLTRKHTLEYDDVLNQQREVIYTYRDEILEGRDMSEAARAEISSLIERLVDEYTAGDFVEDWDVEGLLRPDGRDVPAGRRVPGHRSRAGRPRGAQGGLRAESPRRSTTQREEELGDELMREVERFLLLQIIDQRWREHLYDMDYLREGIHLRGFAQIEPLVAYKNEAFELFRDLMNSDLGRLRPDDLPRRGHAVEGPNGGPPEPPPGARPSSAASSPTGGGRVTYSGGGGAPQGAMAIAAAAGGAVPGDAGAVPEEPDARPGRAAPRRPERADRAQRSVLVRVGQEVQEVSRGVTPVRRPVGRGFGLGVMALRPRDADTGVTPPS